MKKTDIVITLIGVLAVVAVVIYVKQQDQPLQGLDLPPETDVQSVTVEPEEPEIRYPVPEPTPPIEPPAAEPETPEQAPPPAETDAAAEQTGPENPLPTLDESDAALRQDLYILATRQALESLFNLDRIIRRFVVTVDNLPRKHLPRSKYRSNRMVSGRFRVAEDSYGMYLGEENFARYAAFVDLLESMNTDQLVALYLYYYPLIQAAYEDMGYPSAYFNDRLVDVIDQLLRTPDVSGRIRLVRPRVLYKYADPELEALSAGQKVLIRIGPRNASRVKTKLRELRKGLVRE
jgi:Protein of unknown function (DUF3014)